MCIVKKAYLIISLLLFFKTNNSLSHQGISSEKDQTSIEERNKEIARNFYEDLWFNNRTENYAKYVADEYLRRDIGDLPNTPGVVEKAISQKETADRFWNGGSMSGFIDYQVAEGDYVATRWYWSNKPDSFMSWFLIGEHTIPIINVFKFKDGKITEIHNHRHDISLNYTNIFLLKGLSIGLLLALIPTFLALRYKKKFKTLQKYN